MNIRVGWEKPEKLHLSLKFFGDVEEARIPQIGTALDEVVRANEPFAAELAATGVFPNEHNARVLWVGVKRGGGKIAEIARQIETMCRHVGLPEDEPRFSPHLTIARLRDRRGSRDLVARHLGANLAPVAFEIRELKIYESSLLPSGSIYTLVSTHKFKNG